MNQQDMIRILCGHQWRCLQEWVNALDELADLSDAEVDATSLIPNTRSMKSDKENPRQGG